MAKQATSAKAAALAKLFKAIAADVASEQIVLNLITEAGGVGDKAVQETAIHARMVLWYQAAGDKRATPQLVARADRALGLKGYKDGPHDPKRRDKADETAVNTARRYWSRKSSMLGIARLDNRGNKAGAKRAPKSGQGAIEGAATSQTERVAKATKELVTQGPRTFADELRSLMTLAQASNIIVCRSAEKFPRGFKEAWEAAYRATAHMIAEQDAKPEAPKAEPAKAEPAKAEPAKAEPAKVAAPKRAPRKPRK
jgi:hypothetical protein